MLIFAEKLQLEYILDDLGFSDDQIAEYYGSVRNKYIKVSKKTKFGQKKISKIRNWKKKFKIEP